MRKQILVVIALATVLAMALFNYRNNAKKSSCQTTFVESQF